MAMSPFSLMFLDFLLPDPILQMLGCTHIIPDVTQFCQWRHWVRILPTLPRNHRVIKYLWFGQYAIKKGNCPVKYNWVFITWYFHFAHTGHGGQCFCFYLGRWKLRFWFHSGGFEQHWSSCGNLLITGFLLVVVDGDGVYWTVTHLLLPDPNHIITLLTR